MPQERQLRSFVGFSRAAKLSLSHRLINLVGTEGADAKLRLEQGFDMVSVTTDIGTVSKGIMQEMAVLTNGKVAERNGY